MRDSKDVMVQVSESQLRQYAQRFESWERLAQQQQERIAELMNRIDCLEAEKELRAFSEPDTIDLFA